MPGHIYIYIYILLGHVCVLLECLQVRMCIIGAHTGQGKNSQQDRRCTLHTAHHMAATISSGRNSKETAVTGDIHLPRYSGNTIMSSTQYSKNLQYAHTYVQQKINVY